MHNSFPKPAGIQRSSHVIHFSNANIKHEFNEAETRFARLLETTIDPTRAHAICRSQSSVIFVMPTGQAASKRPQVGMQPELSQMLVNDHPRDSPFTIGKSLSLEKVKVVD